MFFVVTVSVVLELIEISALESFAWLLEREDCSIERSRERHMPRCGYQDQNLNQGEIVTWDPTSHLYSLIQKIVS